MDMKCLAFSCALARDNGYTPTTHNMNQVFNDLLPVKEYVAADEL